MRHKMYIKILVSLVLLCSSAFAKDALTLEEYLIEVKQTHQGITAALKGKEGSIKESEQGELLLAPTLDAIASYTEDKRPTIAPAVQGIENTFYRYSLGVSKLTTFGLRGRLSYNLDRTELFGTTPGFVPLNKYYDAYPKLEVTQSLWKNWLGAQVQAEQEQLEAQSLIRAYTQSFQAKQTLAEAEATYWRLAFAKEALAVQRDSLERSTRLRDWNLRRAKLGLGDRADVLQSEAAYQVRELELQNARDELNAASLAFNSLRGRKDYEVNETLNQIDSRSIDKLRAPKRAELRDDVKAAQQNERVLSAVSKLGLQRLSPDLEFFGNLAYYGRQGAAVDAASDSFEGRRPYWTVGIRLSAPLDLGLIAESREGQRLLGSSAALNYDRQFFEQEQSWLDLNTRLEEAKKRYQLSRSIEKLQGEKLEYERDRRLKGRTTTYQVLLFEQDFSNAQLNRIRAQADVLRIIAQMKTFGDSL